MKILVKQLVVANGLPLPAYETGGAAGLDLRAADDAYLAAGARATVRTGIAVAIPVGYEGQVRSRSGLAMRQGIRVFHGVGTIDADYRGELLIMLENTSSVPHAIERGHRIAQLVISPVAQVGVELVGELPLTARGEGGFGSTGRS
jgi:dUTP pyrophosphatase